MSTRAIVLLSLLSVLNPVLGHLGCGGHEVSRRNPGGNLVTYTKRQSPTEQSEAQLEDPAAECEAYSYQPVLNIRANYPEIWTVASIQSNDTAAQTLFSTINATVNARLPGNAPSGIGADGNTTNVHYNGTDPNCWWTWQHCTTPANSTGIVADVTKVEPNTWALGFDDGPNCSHNALYDYLLEQDQKASMFYIGSNLMDWPLQALRAIDDGHEICVHTWSHRYMTSFTNDVAFAELYYTRQAIKDVLGVTPTCWRPPYGDVDNRIRLIAAELNLTTIVWSEDTSDWKVGTANITTADVDANYQTFVSSAQNGTYSTSSPVILNHELNNYTMAEFVKWYPSIKSAFKYIVPFSAALNTTHPYAETNITAPDFANYTNMTTSASSGSSMTSAVGGTTAGAAASAAVTANVGAASASASASKASGAERIVAGMGIMGLAVLGGLAVLF